MKRLATAAVLLLVFAVAASAKVKVGPANWMDYRPDEPLQIHHAYMTPYTEVVWVADRITLLDGRQVFVLQNVRGRYCKTMLCAWPVDLGRGVMFEVTLTLEPDEPTQ